MTKHFFFSVCLSCCILPSGLMAGFYEEQANRGFYYFEDFFEKEEEQIPQTPEEATEYLEKEKEKLHQLLCLAIVSPTEENIKKYITEQNKWIASAETFAKKWEHLLLDFPELGEGFTNPITTAGIDIRKQSEEQEKKLLIDTLKENHALLLFAQGGEPFSEEAAKILNHFALVTDWEVQVVSLNNLPLQGFKEVIPSQGKAEKLGIYKTPSFFLFNRSGQMTPVGVGVISVSDLIDNIHTQVKRHLLEDPS